jgi:L-alanine-DL-glutamate epimerase-like enolase superfamily enzyme
MIITGFELYPLAFAFVSGGYTTSYGTRTHLNNLLLRILTDSGESGLGEICRKAGNSPEPTNMAFARHCRTTLQALVGADPLDMRRVTARLGDLDEEFSNLRCAVDTACLDLLARSRGQPLWELLGGKAQDSVPVYHTIGQSAPERMADDARLAQQDGCRVLQVKVGGGGGTAHDIACIDALLAILDDDAVMLVDANGGWSVNAAMAVIAGFADRRVYWEEPCRTYPENRQVAAGSGATIILDQCVTGPEAALQACRDGEVAGLGIKCTMQGGLRAGRRSRDYAIEHGLRLKVDDSWSADVACTASLHLAMAVPPDQLIASVDMRAYFHGRVSRVGPVCEAYRFAPNALPGLGLVADLENLGQPMH